MNEETVVVRFSPSPSGLLHIGSARTAIVNYIFKNTKSPQSKFYLRIEDTDKERSKKEYVDIIYENLSWLGITYDDKPVIQSENLKIHSNIANDLLKSGNAYCCFCTHEELQEHRSFCETTNCTQRYSGKCRNLKPCEIAEKLNSGLTYTIRIKVPESSTLNFPFIEVNDLIKGKVKIHYDQLDDFILLRSDGTPTYMLSVVVDDHNMGITHVIRGDDHFTNTFRQICIYNACNWKLPKFGHLPLIYGEDGTKLSKRKQVVGIHDFRNLGYTSEALKLYIGSLGCSVDYQNITFDKILKSFNLKKISKSPVQFDINFLNIINQKIIKSNSKYLHDAIPFIQKLYNCEIDNTKLYILEKAYDDIASRSKTFVDFAQLSLIYLKNPHEMPNELSLKINKNIIYNLVSSMKTTNVFTIVSSEKCANCIFFDKNTIKNYLSKFILENNYSNEEVYNSLRLALTLLNETPPIPNIMYSIGYEECLNRLSSI